MIAGLFVFIRQPDTTYGIDTPTSRTLAIDADTKGHQSLNLREI